MTNKEAAKAIRELRTYAAADLLDSLDYLEKVLEKFEEAGVQNALAKNVKISVGENK